MATRIQASRLSGMVRFTPGEQIQIWNSRMGRRSLALSPVISNANNFFKPKQDVSVAAIEPFVKENTGTGVFRISRSLFSSKTSSLTVNYTASGTATAGSTYTALTGSATIPANQSYVDVSVAPISNLATYTGEQDGSRVANRFPELHRRSWHRGCNDRGSDGITQSDRLHRGSFR